MSAAIARRYAEALADVAIARGLTSQIEAELRGYADIFATNRELYDAFASPIVSQADKQRLLRAIVERTRPNEVVGNLLTLLLRHYRLHQIEAVYWQFRRTMNGRQGIVSAEVTTAAPVDADEQDLLLRQLEQMTGKRVEAQFKTDPSLIGGAVTRIGSTVYDGSIRTRLESIKEELKHGGGA